jgi:hypothetical protein
MVVYPNRGNVITIADYHTFEIVKTITVNVPDSLSIDRMCLSTNKDYFVFCASLGIPPFQNYIVSYNIAKNSIHDIFPTGLDSVGAPRLASAHIPDEPGLIYLYSHNAGLYSIDFFDKGLSLISGEHNQGLDKEFYFTSDHKSIAVLKSHGSDPAYGEIEYYSALSGLMSPQFCLNENNHDSIYVDDLEFSGDASKIFVSIRLPQMIGMANYFGSYDLATKKLYKSSLTFPWSLNPYYLAYNANRGEVYLVGAQNKFYIIGVDSSEYYLKSVVDLTGKIPSPSKILLAPDENVAFVSCVYSDFVIAVDLENRRILKVITVKAPYLMFLL